MATTTSDTLLRKVILLVMLSICLTGTAGIKLRSIHMDTGNGLPDNNVRCVYQDRYGFIWMGTLNGLYRYDGYRYVLFRKTATGNNSLMGSNKINNIVGWKDGMFVLCHSDRFYSCYDTWSGQFVELADSTIRDKHYNRTDIGRDSVLVLYGTNSADHLVIDRREGHTLNRLVRKPYVASRPHNVIRTGGKTVTIDKGFNLCLTDDRTGHTDRYALVPAYLLRQTDDLKIKMVAGRDGLVWVATYGNGLFVLDVADNELTHITADKGAVIRSNYINNIYEDGQGNVWVCQEHFGVSCVTVVKDITQVIRIQPGVSDMRSKQIRALRRIGPDEIFAANNFGYACITDNNLMNVRTLDTGGRNLLSACRDAEGRLWAGSRKDGLCIYSDRTYLGGRWFRHDKTDGTSICDNRIDCIVRDRSDRMWICSFHGGLDLAVADGNGDWHFRHFIKEMERLQAAIVDHRGWIWVAAGNGLYCFDPDKLQRDGKAYRRFTFYDDGRQQCEAVCVKEDSRHRIWAGTSGYGLYRADNDGKEPVFENINKSHGLSNNMVRFIVEDNGHNVWAGTENGCTIFAADGSLHAMHADDGLQDFCNENAAAVLDGNRLAIGSLDGIVVTKADEWIRNSKPRQKPVITDVYVNGESIRDSYWEDRERQAFPALRELNLSHRQNTIRIMFSALAFGDNAPVAYQYRLDGHDNGWSEVQYTGYASYRDLPPGRYVLYVRTVDGMGNTNDNECRLDILISPHWTGTWWARLLFVLIVGGIVAVSVRHLYQIYALRRRIAIEKQMNEYKLRFFTDISHEFRTPLTLMKNSIDHIVDDIVVSGDMRQSLNVMKRSVDRMMRLINQLLEFRKMQNGKLSLRLVECNVVSLLYNIWQDFYYLKEKRNISYQFEHNRKSHVMFTDKGHIDKIAYNLLSNAFKYTPAGGSITLRVDVTATDLEISVKDSGVGISMEQQQRMFERYEHGRYATDSAGIGLNLTYELVRMLKGSIEYEPNPEGGSVFIVRLPLDSSVYPRECFVKEETSLACRHEDEQRRGFEQEYSVMKPLPMNDRTVMVVEDDDDLRAYMEHSLSTYYNIMTAADGEKAIALLQERVPDLVISDVMMPHVNGFELVKYIRKTPQYMYLPIILLTVMDTEEKHFKGLELGADDYMPKPFSMSMLVARTSNLIHQRDNLRIAFSGSVVEKATAPKIITEERDRKLMDVIDSWIDSHLSDPNMTLEMLYEKLGYGRSKFFAKFNSLTGKTPREYIRERKLNKAAEMLRNDEMTISEVAYKLGFSTPQYLSTCFKAYFGMTPSQYQKGN